MLARSDYAYLEAPTGTGKTVVMAMLARSLGIGEVYYLAHTIDLLKQARASLAELVEEGLADPAQQWHFLTWRKYVSSCVKGLIDKDSPHIALVDECHMGGAFQSATQQKRCFPVIRSMATRRSGSRQLRGC
nr:DEAD/DEAH box helicase family protein [Blastomonas fulva]